MAKAPDFLLGVWREVSRHLEIDEFIDSLAGLLRQHVPLSRILVQHIDSEHRRAHVVTAFPSGDCSEFADIHYSVDNWRQIERWRRQEKPIHKLTVGEKNSVIYSLLHARPCDEDWIILPLRSERGARGVLSVYAITGRTFTARQIELVRAASDAVAVALENDARLKEIAALKEAAEADRRSLLQRLGRRSVGDAIVGSNTGLAHVMERVDMVGRSDVPVLILGETGTGKELVARAIHNRSGRQDGPFIRVNCGAIPRELIDSQLFGHEKGAFTGAAESRQGWFERADMGTLFLDEIGELPLEAQVRFLRVLQDGFVERVGGTKLISVNVRVVAATHRDLASMVRENSFREDLWYRIAVFPILLPPLRDRLEDIPELARHFADRAAFRFGLTPVPPTDADIALLQSYDWPGNVRELGAVIDRAAILGDGKTLEIRAAIGPAGSPVKLPRLAAAAIPRSTSQLITLDNAIREHIEAALRIAQGRIEGPLGAALMLAVNPHTLRARMRRLGIDWSAFRPTALP
jgi:transcriptional regulator with GAF, ATPase, and Fis domain